MAAILPYILLLAGFVLLVKGADFFVEGSSSIAKLLKIPGVIIGLTIVAFGTSAPEAAVSITAGLRGANELAVANVIGSNLFNLLMVLGCCALIRPLPVDKSVLVKEYPLSILAAVAMLLMSMDMILGGGTENIISRTDGLILVLFFLIFLYSTIKAALAGRKNAEPEENIKTLSPVKSILMAIGGLAGIVIGGQLVVNSASDIATQFGVSQNLIGLTIVAIGTSLPELVTSVVASKKGENGIALGNVVGSNLFNIFFVLAFSSSLTPIAVGAESMIDLCILVGVSLLIFFYAWSGKRINRIEGGSLVAMYAAYTAYIILR